MHAWSEELAEIGIVALGLFAALSLASQRNDRWARGFARHWLVALLLVAAVAVLVEVTIEVLGNGSAGFDRWLLVAIHGIVPVGMMPVFRAATMTGSLDVLMPATALVAGWLWMRRHRFEGVQLAATLATAALVTYVAKTAVGRVRPALWDTQWFWGSSFPSGHTLSTAAVATALCLCVARLRPSLRGRAIAVALLWVAMVGLSRLVLGVHWPTDVAAAACAGLLVAAGINGLLAASAKRTGILPETA